MLDKLRLLRKSHLASNHNVIFYKYQETISDRILAALLINMSVTEDTTEETVKQLTPQEITIEISRQAGKTSAVVLTVEFIMIWFPVIFDRPISIGIFAPLQRQYKIDFDRLRGALRKTRKDLVIGSISSDVLKEQTWKVKEEENAKTLVLENGARCLVYPVSPTSSPEGETLDLIIIEESQDMTGPREQILTQSIFPMGAATNAPRIFIGTAGTQLCYFYNKVNSKGALVLDCDLVVKDRRKVYSQTRDPRHLIYEQYMTSERERLGDDHDDFKRPFKLVWLLDVGMFVTRPQWESCAVYKSFDAGSQEDHYFGLDTAKEADQTILKIGRLIGDKLTCVYSMGMRGINYEDQFNIILSVLSKFKVVRGAIDSTGQGDFMPDLFERNSRYLIDRVKFSLMSKDVIYKSLYQKIVNGKFGYYHDGSLHSKECDHEILSLVKEYKQNYLSVHHPEVKDAHDDHSDSLALMSYAYDQHNKGSGIMSYYQEQIRNLPTPQTKAVTREVNIWG